jgi:hypothetical protein
VYDSHNVIDDTRETNADKDKGQVEEEDVSGNVDSNDDEDKYTTAVIL